MASSELAGGALPARFHEAYEAVLPELLALSAERLLPVNVDILDAVTTVLGCLPAIRALEPELEKLPYTDVHAIGRLGMYAQALAHANALLAAATEWPECVPSVSEAARKMRDRLASTAAALAERGLLDRTGLEELSSLVGYKTLAHDLLALSALLQRSWDEIQDETSVTIAELDEADQLADRLLRGMGQRQKTPGSLARQEEMRQRAFTLFFRTYDQVRRAVVFLRWRHDDAEEIAPSLYEDPARRPRRESTAASFGMRTTPNDADGQRLEQSAEPELSGGLARLAALIQTGSGAVDGVARSLGLDDVRRRGSSRFDN